MIAMHNCRITHVALVACTLLGSALCSAEVPRNAIVELGPVAYWRLADGGRRIASDEAAEHFGVYHHGATNNTHDGVGRASGGCASFDGKHGCVIIRHADGFLLSEGTVSLWCKPERVSGPQALFSKDASGFVDGGHLTLSLDHARVAARLQSKRDSFELRSREISAGEWVHVAFTFGTGGMKLFVAGRLAGSAEYQGGLDKTSGGKGNHEAIVLGASTMMSASGKSHPLTDHYRGALDEVAIFSRQLSAAEVERLSAATVPRYQSLAHAYALNDPSAWWRLLETAGDVAYDQAGDQHGHYYVQGDGRFDGDDYVDVGAIDVDCARFSIVACFKAASFKVPDARIISKAVGVTLDDHYWMLSTVGAGDRHCLRFRLHTDHGARELIAKESALPLDKWVLAAAVYDGRRMKIYQDGRMVASMPHKGRPKTNSHCRVWIGDNPSGRGSRPFDGSIQDVAIFQKALDKTTLHAMFTAAGKKRRQPPVVPELPTPPEVVIEEGRPTIPPIVIPPRPPLGACPQCGQFHGYAPVIRIPLPTMPAYIPHCDF